MYLKLISSWVHSRLRAMRSSLLFASPTPMLCWVLVRLNRGAESKRMVELVDRVLVEGREIFDKLALLGNDEVLLADDMSLDVADDARHERVLPELGVISGRSDGVSAESNDSDSLSSFPDSSVSDNGISVVSDSCASDKSSSDECGTSAVAVLFSMTSSVLCSEAPTCSDIEKSCADFAPVFDPLLTAKLLAAAEKSADRDLRLELASPFVASLSEVDFFAKDTFRKSPPAKLIDLFVFSFAFRPLTSFFSSI